MNNDNPFEGPLVCLELYQSNQFVFGADSISVTWTSPVVVWKSDFRRF